MNAPCRVPHEPGHAAPEVKNCGGPAGLIEEETDPKSAWLTAKRRVAAQGPILHGALSCRARGCGRGAGRGGGDGVSRGRGGAWGARPSVRGSIESEPKKSGGLGGGGGAAGTGCGGGVGPADGGGVDPPPRQLKSDDFGRRQNGPRNTQNSGAEGAVEKFCQTKWGPPP